MDLPTALDVVYNAIDVVNDLRQANDQIARTPDVALAGEGGCLDSLALATLILAVERRVAETKVEKFRCSTRATSIPSSPGSLRRRPWRLLFSRSLRSERHLGRIGFQCRAGEPVLVR